MLVREVSALEEDLMTVQLLQEAAQSLHAPHSELDALLRDMHANFLNLVVERQEGSSQLDCANLIIAAE